MTLIDSSIWIGFLRGNAGHVVDVTNCLQDGTAALCPVTWLELFAGARGKRESLALDELKGLCVWLEIDGRVWDEASRLGRRARQSGLNCPMADVLIVACATRHGAALIHQDKHLKALSEL